jgi:hypothetical protein
MRRSVFAKLDATLTVLVNHVASDVWLAAGARAIDPAVAALCDPVLPDVWKAAELVTLACTEDAVRVALLNQVLKQLRLVVQELNADVIQTEFILDDLGSSMRESTLRRHQHRLRP